MRREDQVFKTMTAVRGFLNECLRAPAPMATLEQLVKGLRASPQWSDHEVRDVELAARRAIEAARRNPKS
jgi:hypothetical protein